VEVVADSGQVVILDAGTGIRRLGKSLIERKKKEFYMLLTHCHWDHIIGIPFFHPLLCKDTRLIVQDRMIGGINTQKALGEVMKNPFFPVRIDDFQADIRFDSSLTHSFSIGSLEIDSIPTSHSQGSLGYRFREKEKTFVFLTDNELGYAHPQSRSRDEYIDFCKGADLLFHDTEYTADEYVTKTGWGHSSVPDVLDLALKAGVGHLGLIHLNQDRTDDQMDDIVAECNRFFKLKNLTTKVTGISYNFEATL
jgi:ribonuclease BN (tRNA processing enzyme)